jgi:hypothetical protein
LLIALSLRPGFPLPYERGPAWYGLSADSTEKGLRDLQNAGLLDFDHNWLRNVRSETGWTEQRLYSLKGPYAPPPAKRPAKKLVTKGPLKKAPRKAATK